VPQFLTRPPKVDLALTNQPNPALISAGLPFFTTGCWKSWGRDTFISLRGLLIIPGLWKEAREIILHYGSYMRHGLIPNLLDPPRYNCRDATFWFVKGIVDYINESSDFDILKQKVEMKFLSSEKDKNDQLKGQRMIRDQTLIDILQEIMERHAWGIKFTEWNSDKNIDEHMSEEGFNIDLWPDWTNGFIYGGNKYNCLTWMDKMGSSTKALNAGLPGSSRDGAPIEMTAL